MTHKKKPTNNSNIPQHIIESIARCILPDIIAYYETEKGQREYKEWKAKRNAEQTESKVKKLTTNQGAARWRLLFYF